jgi:hypothetical protein
MAHRTLVRSALGLLLALPLGACGGGPGVDETAAEAGVSSAPVSGGDGLPGGPGADSGDGGGADSGDAGGAGGAGVAQGNPGAPGDVTVFEERGVSYADFRDGSAQRVCVDQGLCTLAKPHDPEGTYSDPAACSIVDMDYSTGTHQDAEGRQVYLEGAIVTVTVSCREFTDPDGDGVPGDSTTAEATGDGTAPDAEPQG